MRLICSLLVLLLCLGAPAQAQSGVRNEGLAAVSSLNALRAQSGRAALSVDPRLTQAAASHAADMVRAGHFSHRGTDGSTPDSRVRAQGYGFCAMNESIGRGYSSLAAALDGWMRSAPHRRNLLNAQVTQFGLASGPGGVWVMVMGRPGC